MPDLIWNVQVNDAALRAMFANANRELANIASRPGGGAAASVPAAAAHVTASVGGGAVDVAATMERLRQSSNATIAAMAKQGAPLEDIRGAWVALGGKASEVDGMMVRTATQTMPAVGASLREPTKAVNEFGLAMQQTGPKLEQWERQLLRMQSAPMLPTEDVIGTRARARIEAYNRQTAYLQGTQGRPEEVIPSIAQLSAGPEQQAAMEENRIARTAQRSESMYARNVIMGQRFALLFGVSSGVNQTLSNLTGGNFPLFGPLSSMFGIMSQMIPLTTKTVLPVVGALGGLLAAERYSQVFAQWRNVNIAAGGAEYTGIRSGFGRDVLDPIMAARTRERGAGRDPMAAIEASQLLMQQGTGNAQEFGRALDDALTIAARSGEKAAQVIERLVSTLGNIPQDEKLDRLARLLRIEAGGALGGAPSLGALEKFRLLIAGEFPVTNMAALRGEQEFFKQFPSWVFPRQTSIGGHRIEFLEQERQRLESAGELEEAGAAMVLRKSLGEQFKARRTERELDELGLEPSFEFRRQEVEAETGFDTRGLQREMNRRAEQSMLRRQFRETDPGARGQIIEKIVAGDYDRLRSAVSDDIEKATQVRDRSIKKIESLDTEYELLQEKLNAGRVGELRRAASVAPTVGQRMIFEKTADAIATAGTPESIQHARSVDPTRMGAAEQRMREATIVKREAEQDLTAITEAGTARRTAIDKAEVGVRTEATREDLVNQVAMLRNAFDFEVGLSQRRIASETDTAARITAVRAGGVFVTRRGQAAARLDELAIRQNELEQERKLVAQELQTRDFEAQFGDSPEARQRASQQARALRQRQGEIAGRGEVFAEMAKDASSRFMIELGAPAGESASERRQEREKSRRERRGMRRFDADTDEMIALDDRSKLGLLQPREQARLGELKAGGREGGGVQAPKLEQAGGELIQAANDLQAAAAALRGGAGAGRNGPAGNGGAAGVVRGWNAPRRGPIPGQFL